MTRVAVAAIESTSQAFGQRLARHWFMAFALVYGVWVFLPWLAPIFMEAGWTGAGRVVYLVYSLFCHQLPERSFFLFGQHAMYPLAEIQAAFSATLNPMLLRKFIGNASMGWKVAWSDRMVSFYTTVWFLAVLWWPLRRRIKPLPLWGLLLLLLPMGLDGITHAVSDFSGLGRGFRDSNAWLLTLTQNGLPLVYAGDALGSFNSWARLLTGFLAGLGIAWFVFPLLERPVAPVKE